MLHASWMHQGVGTGVSKVGGQPQGRQGYLQRNHLIAAMGSKRAALWLSHQLSPECGGILE